MRAPMSIINGIFALENLILAFSHKIAGFRQMKLNELQNT